MLHKQRSRKIAILKYGLFIPLFGVALILSSATIQNNEKIQSIADNIPLNTPIEVVNDVITASIAPIAPKSTKGRQAIDQDNRGKEAGWDDFYKFVKKSLRYPVSAQENKIMGTTMIKFTVSAGQVDNVGIATKLGGGLDAEALRAVVLFPAYKSIMDGKYTVKVKFHLSDLESPNVPSLNKNIASLKGYTALQDIIVVGYGGKAITDSDPENKVYDFVSIETQPGFPGGMHKLYAYLKSAIKYPAEALENNVQGKVFLSFIVEKDGSLNDIKVERKLGSGTDEEAVRVLKASPKWIPGTQNGKPVRVKYNIPISFNSGKPLDPSTKPQNKQGSTVPSGTTMGIRFKDNNGGEMKLGDNPGKYPLVILDGQVTDMSTMQAMNPNTIESISVLKDNKATTLYGSKAVNGVIIIKSKTKSLNEVQIGPKKKE